MKTVAKAIHDSSSSSSGSGGSSGGSGGSSSSVQLQDRGGKNTYSYDVVGAVKVKCKIQLFGCFGIA